MNQTDPRSQFHQDISKYISYRLINLLYLSICNGLDRCAVYKTRTDATLPPSSDDESEPELAGP